MRRSSAVTTLVLVFATAFVLGIAPNAQASEHKARSNHSLQGSFGFTSTGALLPEAAPPPFCRTVTGTYTVNPDCTGSMTLNVSPLGITAHADFVIDDEGLELRTIDTDPGVVEIRVYKKQFRGNREE